MKKLTFAEYYNINPDILNKYGAINPCIAYDLPLFIDPFLIFASEKKEYKNLHASIIKYLRFLLDIAPTININSGKFKHWFVFSEIKQNCFGYSENGNDGKSGAKKMGRALKNNLEKIFDSYGISELENVIHLSELNIIEKGIGKDNISDFTTQLIFEYLLEYTQTFTLTYISENQRIKKTINNAYFNYEFKRWLPKEFVLPKYGRDYMLLVPKDIVVREELWINKEDMLESFEQIPIAISNLELRDTLSNLYYQALPQVKKKDGTIREPYKKEKRAAAELTITKNPIAIKYYIKSKEDNRMSIVEKNTRLMDFEINRISSIIPSLASELATRLKKELSVKPIANDSYSESISRILYLKKVIECQDGYKLFYDSEGNIIRREIDLQKYFKAVWYASDFNADSEVNNGRGPVDFKVSYGKNDQTIIEFKLASNNQIKDNLKEQAEVYAAANDNPKIIKVIMFFTYEEEKRIKNILQELDLLNKNNIILIDARNDNKLSASKVKTTK